MQATQLTEGCATVAVVLGIIGLYFDSLSAVAGAMGLTGLLCGQGVLFLYRTARLADNLHIERGIKSRPVFLGTLTEVGVQATVTAVPGLSVRLTDLPPVSAIYDPDEATICNGEGWYHVRFMAPGEISFRGVLLETANRFFITTILLSPPRDAGEKLVVHPVGSGTLSPPPGNSVGLTYRDRAGWPHGEGVRGFRPFHQGDDPARIDWKLTAKHGRPFVREPTSEVGNAPLLVVDLPAPEAPGTVSILSAAGVEIRREIQEYGLCSLLLIAGGEVIAFHRREKNLEVLLRLLSVRPPVSIRPLYRVKDPVVLMERLRSAERELSIPSQRLATSLRSFLEAGSRSSFEREVDRVLAVAEQREVIVYTASAADTSHLNMIAAAARRRRRHLVIRLPRSVRGTLTWISPYPRVEAI